MTEDRLMIVEAVFNGLIGQEHLTQDEIDEFMELVCDAAIQKELDAAMERGCAVFSGYEDESIH
jgi:hypothetical protein